MDKANKRTPKQDIDQILTRQIISNIVEGYFCPISHINTPLPRLINHTPHTTTKSSSRPFSSSSLLLSFSSKFGRYFSRLMARVHPNIGSDVPRRLAIEREEGGGRPAEVLTVWRKSLLLNCYGFTVFDAKGNLVFRVDNYAASNRAEVVLMDASGKPLLTIRRKRLSLGDHWLVYAGETTVNPLFSVKKNLNLLSSKLLAYATAAGNGRERPQRAIYEIEGSYSQRSCAVYDDSRQQLAEIKRKEAVFGVDVFRLVVQPELDSAVAMALVILLEQMYGSRRSSP